MVIFQNYHLLPEVPMVQPKKVSHGHVPKIITSCWLNSTCTQEFQFIDLLRAGKKVVGTRGDDCKKRLKSYFGISKDLHHAGFPFMGQNDTGMGRPRIAQLVELGQAKK